jgi:hypothetical protein
MKPSPSPVVLADAATVIKYTSYRGLKQACYIRMLSDEFIPRLKSRVFSAFPINKGTFFIMFIFMTLLGIAKGGVFVRIFLLCLSGVVVYFSKRVYILACKKADVSKIANSAQEIGVITFVFAIVCGFVELMALCCSSL